MVIVVDLIGYDEKREGLTGDGRYETVDNSSREGKPILESPTKRGRKEGRENRIRILVSLLSTPPLTYDDV